MYTAKVDELCSRCWDVIMKLPVEEAEEAKATLHSI
jgi:hypothetical protein